jgi:phosphoglycerate dehydrogenase-like enzyme
MMHALVPFAELTQCAELRAAGVRTTVYERGQAPTDTSGTDDVEFAVLPSRSRPEGLALLNALPQLRVVQLLSSGVDHLASDLPGGVLVCNAPELHATPTAELAVTLILAAFNHTAAWHAGHRQAEWVVPPPRRTLRDSTVVLIGYGAVGRELAPVLAAFGASVFPVARHARDGVAAIDQLADLLPTADVVVVAAALTEHTRGLVNADLLDRMLPGALLVNLARGALVDTDALVSRLHTGQITAALDVTDPEPLPTDHPLWTAPGVLISPHVGGKTVDFRVQAVNFLRAQLLRCASGGRPNNIVINARRAGRAR